ncbi:MULTISPECIES: HipA domain-containing protein [unclassified Leucobacter]|uniref:HipA domain-containing protein n=1 Tax=unclassified Leucobacter TaxID=2621730 RepID=UPI00039E1067|nr:MULTISPECIES: HipA domain-containing protein [unclassified Leucobacter]RGE16490.1 type II toxin-antitoxin system HipA family toxin [Leucobacter sp. wl10]
MSERIEVWLEGRHVGQFVFDEGDVTFVYDEDAPPTPISLSLPRDRPAVRKAARNFLENLLPEHEQTRARMANAYGAKSAGAFDLLNAAGGDLAGGLVLLPEGESLQDRLSELSPALKRDIADRISAIKRDSSDTTPRDVAARFSLAGAQGKFALAWVDGDWYWSNETVPSTHIVKPGNPKYRGIEAAEVAAIDLAYYADILAPESEVMSFGDQTAYVVTRFDRTEEPDQLARRLHAEDIAQSLGLPPEKKYDVSAGKVISLLKPIDPSGKLQRVFLSQLILNVLVGNADAHAKNYSLLLRPDAISFAPIYDVVPLFLYPEVEQELAMKIGGARRSQEVTPAHWRILAQRIGFDVDELLARVREIAEYVGKKNDRVWDALDADQQVQAREFVARNVERAVQIS